MDMIDDLGGIEQIAEVRRRGKVAETREIICGNFKDGRADLLLTTDQPDEDRVLVFTAQQLDELATVVEYLIRQIP